jgi:hypothetical protein
MTSGKALFTLTKIKEKKIPLGYIGFGCIIAPFEIYTECFVNLMKFMKVKWRIYENERNERKKKKKKGNGAVFHTWLLFPSFIDVCTRIF